MLHIFLYSFHSFNIFFSEFWKKFIALELSFFHLHQNHLKNDANEISYLSSLKKIIIPSKL
jgi:hypothetical protein